MLLYSKTRNRTIFFLPAARRIFDFPKCLNVLTRHIPVFAQTQDRLKLSLQIRAGQGLWVNSVTSQACACHLLQHALCTFLTLPSPRSQWMSFMDEFEDRNFKNPSCPIPSIPLYPHTHSSSPNLLQNQISILGTNCSFVGSTQ